MKKGPAFEPAGTEMYACIGNVTNLGKTPTQQVQGSSSNMEVRNLLLIFPLIAVLLGQFHLYISSSNF